MGNRGRFGTSVTWRGVFFFEDTIVRGEDSATDTKDDFVDAPVGLRETP